MTCSSLKESYTGKFSNLKRLGKGILTENEREFFVCYDEKGNEISSQRKRTFESVRIMISKNNFLSNISEYFLVG